VTVKFNPLSGKEDASGGIVFRFANGKDYLVRANALEDNVRLYDYDRDSRRERIVTPRALGSSGSDAGKENPMKWITRERARVDRIACPWLISRFIDKEPTFMFVPADQVKKVAEREGAIPYDIPGVELGHHGEHCSFDAFLEKYALAEPALRTLALIVRGADTDARQLTPESAGLYALATGFQAMAKNDHDNMAKQFPAYDALYVYCRENLAPGRAS